MLTSAQPDLSGLTLLAHDGRLDVRQVLLRVHTDLFVTAPARDRAAIQAFEALAQGLLPAADDATAARVARKLAPCPDTPASILAALTARGGEARRAVAQGSPWLDPHLLDAALAGDLDLAEAIASRPRLDPRAAERLAAASDAAVDFALALNRGSALPDGVLDALTARARENRTLAEALLSRSDLTVADEAALYCHAGPERRASIRAAVGAVAAARRRPGLPRADESDRLALEGLAADGNRAGFDAHLAACLGLEGTPDWRFELPARHDLLALALAAAGVPSEAAIRIFLLLDPRIGRSADAVLALAGIARTVERPTATFLVEAVLARPVTARRAGRHLPLLGEDAARARPAAERRAAWQDGARRTG